MAIGLQFLKRRSAVEVVMNTFEYDDQESSSSGFLTGVMWGIAIGAVGALFLAPRRGAELREQVAGSMNRASRRAVDTYTRASETVVDVAGRAADIAGNLTDRAAMLTAKLNRAMASKTYPPIS
jgi:gas vesicle protein